MSSRTPITLAACCAAGLLMVSGTAEAAGGAHAAPVAAAVAAGAPATMQPLTHQILVPGTTRAGVTGRSAAASTLSVSVTGGDNKGLYDAALNVSVSGSAGAVSATPTWDGVPSGAVTEAGDGTIVLRQTFSTVGEHKLSLSVTDGVSTVVKTETVLLAGNDYTAYGPTRLLDTRHGTGGPIGPIKPNSMVRVKIDSNGGISATASAAVLNLTVTNPSSAGYITAYPDGGSSSSSNVNFVKGQTVPNLSVVPVGTSGYVDLYNHSSGTVDLIADIDGYFSQTAASGYTTVAPARLVDTRSGLGAPKAQLTAGGSIAVQIAGKAGMPASGVTAVALNVTATNEATGGYLTAYPDGAAAPTASNVNFGPGQNIANAVVVPVGADGKIRIAGSTKADAVVDVTGYYSVSGTGAFEPLQPTRLMDTRDLSNPNVENLMQPYYYDLYPFWEWVDANAAAVVLNVTVPTAKAAGYLAVAPDINTWASYQSNTFNSHQKAPGSSTLNFQKGQSVPNMVQASTGTTGVVDFWNQSPMSNDLIIDIFGVYKNN
ncbi:hypothetical protein ABUW04_13040 [Streptacidiphilus sp. N1-10]|uniref:Uncharacterized protein n=1 Tax=Streptacidiphilus jeojiensis TaxID=3229225 RepID=A0ABV6XMJ8_9ACTN